jgi:hypothetical protein
MVALVLSAMVVTLTALIGRGTLNLRGALVLDEPTDVTVIAAVEPKLEDKVTISNITFLRKESAKIASEKPSYSYLVQTSDETKHLVQLKWNGIDKQWTLATYESLHGDPLQ